jgi:predicted transcriptional regulator
MFLLLPLEKNEPIIGNRTRIEILASILDVAHNGALKTHIMYRANLSHRQLEKYLAFLTSNQLLEEVRDEVVGHRYRVTEKGIEFLRDYSRLSAHLTGKL